MENDFYSRTVTADGVVDAFIPGEIVEFARQNKAVRERLAARENERLQEENRKLRQQKQAAKAAAKAERKRQRRMKLACSMVIGTAGMLGLVLLGLVNQTVGILAIAAGMAVGGYRMK
jgi:predicted methyltransferase